MRRVNPKKVLDDKKFKYDDPYTVPNLRGMKGGVMAPPIERRAYKPSESKFKKGFEPAPDKRVSGRRDYRKGVD